MAVKERPVRVTVVLPKDEYQPMHNFCEKEMITHRAFFRQAIREKLNGDNKGDAMGHK